MIHERAMLSNLTIRMWGGERTDREASREITIMKRSEAGSARLVKSLVPESYIKPLKNRAEKIRYIWRSASLPWTNDGQRIISTDGFFPLQEKMAPAIEAFTNAAQEFAHKQYPVIVAGAAQRLGDLFNPGDYPDPDEIEGRYGASLTFTPVPAADDWRIKLDEAHVQYLTLQVESNLGEGIEKAMRHLVDRAIEQVERLHDRIDALDKGGGDRKAQLKGAVLDGISRIASELPLMNITGDARVDRVAREIKEKLARYDVKVIRENPAVRSELKSSSASILDTLKAYSVAA